MAPSRFQRGAQFARIDFGQIDHCPALTAPGIVDRGECLGMGQTAQFLFVRREFQVGGFAVGVAGFARIPLLPL